MHFRNYRFLLNIFIIFVCTFFIGIIPAHAIPAFPGAIGFGSDTVAGRGGQIIKVTNLNKNGEGSFKEALLATGPRIIVFEVGGTIQIDDSIGIRNPFVTIAGQTAPSPGITLRGATLVIATHDVLIQHIRVRTGDQGGVPATNRDALQIEPPYSGGDVYNVVVDHCSLSWGVDENISIWSTDKGDVHDITISNCIISEALYDSIHPEGPHSMGIIIGPRTEKISLIGNLISYCKDRVPYIRSKSVVVANNYIYKSSNPIIIRDLENPVNASIVGNIVNSEYFLQIVAAVHPSDTRIYAFDNVCNTEISNQLEGLRDSTDTNGQLISDSAPVWPTGFSALESNKVEDYVLNNAGARPQDYDSIDTRIINQVSNKTGGLIDSQYQVEGWLSLSAQNISLSIPSDPNGDDDGDYYTNIEEYLHDLDSSIISSNENLFVQTTDNVPNPPTGLTIRE